MQINQVEKRKIEKAAAAKHAEIARLEREAAQLREQIDAYVTPRKKRIDAIAESVKTLQTTAHTLEKANFVHGAVSDAVAGLRARIEKLTKEEAKKSITVHKAEQLRAQITSAKKALQKACAHPFVLRTDGTDSVDCDGDDRGWPGQAGCVVCGLVAADEDHKNNNATFPNDGMRIVRRMIDEVGYQQGHSDEKFAARLLDYAALPDIDAIKEKFYGPKRLKHLLTLLDEKG